MEETIGFGGLGKEGFIMIAATLAVLVLVSLLMRRRRNSSVRQNRALPLVFGVIMILLSVAWVLLMPGEGNLLSLFVEDGGSMTTYDTEVWNDLQRQFVRNNLRGIKTFESLTDGTMFCNAMIAVFSMLAASLAAKLLTLLFRCEDQEKWNLPAGILMNVGTGALAATLLLPVGKWLYLGVLWIVSWISSWGFLGVLLTGILAIVIALSALYFISQNCATFLCATTLMMIAGVKSMIIFLILYVLIEAGFQIISEKTDKSENILRLYCFGYCFALSLALSLVKGIFGTSVMQIAAIVILVASISYFRTKKI